MKEILLTHEDGTQYGFRKVENKNGSQLRMECRKVGESKPPYIVTYNPSAYGDSEHEGWSCGCKAWCMKRGARRKCRHLSMIAVEMAARKTA